VPKTFSPLSLLSIPTLNRRRQRCEGTSDSDSDAARDDNNTATAAAADTPNRSSRTKKAPPPPLLRGTFESSSSETDDDFPLRAAEAAAVRADATAAPGLGGGSNSSSSDDSFPRLRRRGMTSRSGVRADCRLGGGGGRAAVAERVRTRAVASSLEEPAPLSTGLAAAAAPKPARELSIVEKHVRAMMNKRAEEQLEQVRLGQRADALRLGGEAQLCGLGDLDEDSDSGGDDGGAVGATGRARRRSKTHDGKFDGAGDVVVRAMTAAELGMAYAWMKRDQRRQGVWFPPFTFRVQDLGFRQGFRVQG